MSRPPGLGDFEWQRRKDGLLLAECWCQHHVVLVAPEAVRAGVTGSCDRDDGVICDPNYRPPQTTVWAILDVPLDAIELRSAKGKSGWRKTGAPGDTVRAIETARRHVTAPGRWPVPTAEEPAR